MIDIAQLIPLLLRIQLWDLVKVLICFALFIYILVALVVVRQVNMMTEVVHGQMDAVIKAVALIHLLGAILVFLIALMIL
jgi:hypothetical protein